MGSPAMARLSPMLCGFVVALAAMAVTAIDVEPLSDTVLLQKGSSADVNKFVDAATKQAMEGVGLPVDKPAAKSPPAKAAKGKVEKHASKPTEKPKADSKGTHAKKKAAPAAGAAKKKGVVSGKAEEKATEGKAGLNKYG